MHFAMQRDMLLCSLGESQKMVLSTSLGNKVTSRTMSIVIMNGKFYFQTDIMFRKYEQLLGNQYVALCLGNTQIEGVCMECGRPEDNPAFCEVYKKQFPSAYNRYTGLENERVFEVTPSHIQKWIYEDDQPFVERLDFVNMTYNKEQYTGV